MHSLGSWRLLVVGLALMGGLGACKCEGDAGRADGGGTAEREYESTVSKLPGAPQVDVAALIPAGVDWALMSDHPDQVYGWLEKQAWFLEMRQSPLWADFTLSGGMYELSTARHRLAALSPVEFKQPEMREILKSPMGIAAVGKGPEARFLLVKQIDLKVQALDRLAEVFNQVRDGEQMRSAQQEGVTVRSLRLGDERALHYALYSNLLLASNHPDLLLASIRLAAGRSEGSLATDAATGAVLKQRKEAQLTLLARPKPIATWLGLLLPAKLVALDLKLAPKSEWIVHGQTDGLAGSGLDGAQLKQLAGMIPLQARIVYGVHSLDLNAWLGALSRALPGAEKGKRSQSAAAALGAALTGEAFAVWHGLKSQGRPRPELSLILKTKAGAAVDEPLRALLASLFGAAPTEAEQGIQSVAGEDIQVSFAQMEGGWIVLGTSPAAVAAVLATQRGQAPSLLDQAGFEQLAVAGAMPFFGLAYVDCERLFGDLSEYARAVVQTSDRFDANDVGDTIEPFLKALGKVGKLAGGLTGQQKNFSGRFASL